MAEPQEGTAPPEYVIAKVLHKRLEQENSLTRGEREAVAYRLSEIMVCAKDLYTKSLPRLMDGASAERTLEEEISGVRMTLLHLRDLVTDFDNAFLDAMFHERKGSPGDVYHEWKEAPEDEDGWTAEDLGVGPEEMEEG